MPQPGIASTAIKEKVALSFLFKSSRGEGKGLTPKDKNQALPTPAPLQPYDNQCSNKKGKWK